MSSTRGGRNYPEAMDLWLESQGYCRKPIARDGSCLFRAFAEQVFMSQKFHVDVRNQCVNYMKEHLDIFTGHEVNGGIESYLNLMLIPTQWGGMLEIKAMSELYKVDVLLFQEVGISAQNVTKKFCNKSVMLCLSPEQQYDSVYTKDRTKIAAFCQSLVYEVLYKEVFHMKDVDFAVSQMLHHKAPRHRGELGGFVQRKFFNFGGNNLLLQRRGVVLRNLLDYDEEEVDVKELLNKGITPFPYKVAKSLDPSVYRNVELDVWIDYRRGLRFFGSHNELRVGVKCFVKIDDATFVAHIQEMQPNHGPVLVFVEELGEKRTVPYESLELMPQELQVVKPLPLLSSGNNRIMNSIPKSLLSLQDYSKSIMQGGKLRKRRSSGDELKSKENGSSSFADQRGNTFRKGRFRSKSDLDNSINNQMYQEDNMSSVSENYEGFTVNSFNNTIPSYQLYHPELETNMESASEMPLSVQAHVFMQSQSQGSPPIFIPVSPRPEDIPAHWLQTNGSTMDSMMISPLCSGATDNGPDSGYNQSLLANDVLPSTSFSSSSDQVKMVDQKPNPENFVKDDSGIPEVDVNSNYMHDNNSQNGQINYNVSKSVLENGADLPLSDIQTLRFFYNLGIDIYHAQYGMYSFSGFAQGYSQPCASSTPSPAGSPGMCPGKFCSCGPVCITTVPTIHQLLEPSTPPPNTRRRRKDSVNNPTGPLQSESDSPSPSRFNKKDSKGRGKKDLKVYQGQPLQQTSSLETPASSSISISQDGTSKERGCDSSQDNDALLQADTNGSALAVPYSPPYGYVYCPSSPGVQFSPLDSDPYFTPLRLQCPREYLPDTPQSPPPPCFSVSGDMYTNQIPMFPSTSHYLFPSSPGIYVGSPPRWTPITPPPPAQ